jgi:SNF2 family DNA or RNA helicase/uncharacterized Zn finger protein
MAKNFGNTWWGNQWIKSIEKIDSAKRLPKGKLYAQNGSIINIKINNGIITSKVQGTKNSPYHEIVKLRNFTSAEKNLILKTIIENPVYMLELMNKKLSTGLYEDLLNKKIFLFPSSWDSIHAGCSCPDFAVPCKHIGAVLYVVANEIDKNPFLIFLLKGLDLFKELNTLEVYQLPEKSRQSFFDIDKILKEKINEISNNYTIDTKKILKIDFSKIVNIDDSLVSILPSKPTFYTEGDFRSIIARVYKNNKKRITRILEGLDKFIDYRYVQEIFDNDLSFYNDMVGIRFDENYNYKLQFNNKDSSNIGKTLFISLINNFSRITLDEVLKYSDRIVFLFLVYDFCLALLKKGAYIPQILKIKDNNFIIRWIPALLNEETKNVFDKMVKIMPDNIVSFKIFSDESGCFKNHYPKREEQFIIVSSIFLNIFVEIFNAKNINENNTIERIFFKCEVLNSQTSFEYSEMPAIINLWLSRFYLSDKDYSPLLKIDEENGKYFLEILIDKKDKHEFYEPFNLRNIFEKQQFKNIKTDILKDLNLLSDFLPEINSVINSEGRDKVAFNSLYFSHIFFKILPAIRMLGIKILLPRGLDSVVIPKVSLSISKSKSSGSLVNYMNLTDILSFEWKIALGNNLIAKSDFIKIVRGLSGIVKIQDQFVYISDKEISEILRYLERENEIDVNKLIKAGLEKKFHNVQVDITDEAKKIYKDLFKNEDVGLPVNLNANLRDYQKKGYHWLYGNLNKGFGCLIADDMGLGKTLQVISLLQKLKEDDRINEHKCLVVVPTALLTNWNQEIKKFAPDINLKTYHGKDRDLKIDSYDVVLTTYGIIRNEIEVFQELQWLIVVLDEAQNIKNPNSIQARAIKKLNSFMKVAMSGTPIENRLIEVWSIFDFISKGYLGSLQYFKKEFAIPIEIFRDQDKLEKFRILTGPFILRRLKSDKMIIKDLPDKIEINKYCDLTEEQTALYQNVVNKAMKKIEDSEGIARKGLILKLMVSLKQICNHPSHYLKNPNAKPSLSGKSMMLLNILDKIYENNEKVLIFTQYKEMGELLVKIIKNRFNNSIGFIHGGVSRKKRDYIIDNFQNKKNENTLILTLKAAGVGLNLTSATNVVHYDLWWNPATENQATDRAYRIGQTKNVLIQRLISQGTLEEKINNMINAKKELAEIAISKGDIFISEFNDDEIRKIVSLEKEDKVLR